MKGIEIFQIALVIFITFIVICTVYRMNNTNYDKLTK